MEKIKAIPGGYMTVGEVAKRMGVTVRTLQYYDKEGLLAPSSESEGGRRLYTNKDIVRLHQVLSLKHLGFSLDDIKNRLMPMDTPADVSRALTEQAACIRGEIAALSESLREIEALQQEVSQMQSVDFKRYADIIINLKMNNEFYWLIKYMDEETLEKFRGRFDRESGQVMMQKVTSLLNRANELKEQGVPPESEQGVTFAGEVWHMIEEFTGGDMRMLPKLMEIDAFTGEDTALSHTLAVTKTYIEPALEAYFTATGYNPFEGGAQ